MQVLKDVIYADILVNNGGTSISPVPPNAAFCETLVWDRGWI